MQWYERGTERRLEDVALLREIGRFTVGRLVQSLTEVGIPAELDRESGEIHVHGLPGLDWNPALRLVVTDEALQAHLEQLAAQGGRTWRLDGSAASAYREFLIDLGDHLSASDAGAEIIVSAHGVATEPLSGKRFSDSGESRLEFMSPEQFRRRFGFDPVVPPRPPNPFDEG